MKRVAPEPGGGAERKASQAEKMAWAKAVWWEGPGCAGPEISRKGKPGKAGHDQTVHGLAGFIDAAVL